MMSGTILTFCSISAFSAQQDALERCRKECNKERDERIVEVEADVEPCLAFYSLNSLCHLWDEGVPSFRLCASLFCVLFRRWEGDLCGFRLLQR